MKQHIALTNSEIMSRISEIIHSKRDRDLMRDAPDEHTRMKFQRFIDEIENA